MSLFGWPTSWRKTYEEWCGLSADELTQLATFNSERERGLLHSPEWKERMASLQHRFDTHRANLPETPRS